MSNVLKGLRHKKALMLRAGALLVLLCAVSLATSTALPTEAAAPSRPAVTGLTATADANPGELNVS